MEQKIERIKQAIKECYKKNAGGRVGGGICDSCNSPLSEGETYLCANQIWCESCTDKTLNADYIDWSKALKNINAYFGPGLPSYIQDIADDTENFTLRNASQTSLDWNELRISPSVSEDLGSCECCGNMRRYVSGFVSSSSLLTVATYFVSWTLNSPKHGADFDIIMVGKWEYKTIEMRQGVSLEYRVIEHHGSFRVIDSTQRPIIAAHLKNGGLALKQEEVVGQPIAQNVFALTSAVFMKDKRIQEIRQWS